MKIKPIKNVWVVVDNEGNPDFYTLSHNKDKSIAFTERRNYDVWNNLCKDHTVQKVNINFEVVE